MHSIQTTTDVDQQFQLKGSIWRVYYTCNVTYKLHVKEYTKNSFKILCNYYGFFRERVLQPTGSSPTPLYSGRSQSFLNINIFVLIYAKKRYFYILSSIILFLNKQTSFKIRYIYIINIIILLNRHFIIINQYLI